MTEVTALERGMRVAWVLRSNGKTCGLSSIHRVCEDGKTYCNHVVPPESQQLQPLISLNVCRRCEAMHGHASEYTVQQTRRGAA